MLAKIARYVLLLGIFLSPLLMAAETPEDAKALLDEAVAFYHANGKDKTFAEINNPDGMLRRGELYIFVYDANGTVVAHGVDSTRVGDDKMEQQDANGKFFSKELMSVQKSGESVDYVWPNPKTGKIEPKTTYVYLVDEYRFGCGIYQ